MMSRMGRVEEAVTALKTAFEKGYRRFNHIAHDDDVDAIRDRDVKGKSHYMTASGDIHEGAILKLKEVKLKEYRGFCSLQSEGTCSPWPECP